MSEVQVIIESKGDRRCYRLRRGLGLQALHAQQTTPLEFDCRKADCGICIVRVRAGQENLSPPTADEADFLRAMHADADERLACQIRLHGDASFFLDPYE